MLPKIGKVVVVVVGIGVSAGVLWHQEHHPDQQSQEWVAHPGAPNPDHGEHGTIFEPGHMKLPRGVAGATGATDLVVPEQVAVSFRQACAGQGQGGEGASVRPGSVLGLRVLGR